MAIPLTINGVVFEYPENFDEGWGVNATGWAQAVTNGMLQRTGGNFPLLADTDFGASFGLKSVYYKSRASNIATAGTLRLASADPGIGFRNALNNANLILTTDASDNLSYAGQLSSTGIYLRDTEGTPKTVDVKAPDTLSTNWTLKLPVDAGGGGQFLSTDGSGNTSWANAAGGGTVNSGSATHVAYYATSSNVIDSAAPLFFPSAWSLVFQPTTATVDTEFQVSSPGASSSSATIFLHANNLFTKLSADSSGNFLIQDFDSPSTILSYSRSGQTISFGGNRLVSVADGTSASDVAAFGQVQYGFQNAVQFSGLGSAAIVSGSYTTLGVSVTITPTSSSSRIKISATGSLATTVSGHVSLFRGSTNLAGSDKDFIFYTSDSSLGITYIDSPATTSATTYTLYGKGTVTLGGANILTVLIAEELR